MIVKNEEKNIRRALSWGKEIVSEQIVVDTGSTDRTVEIAEELGAKVYHFKWINDFSAAKNYAIEQASGEWIAFLDADEYFDQKSAERLLSVLQKAEKMKQEGKLVHAVRSTLVNVNDSATAGVTFQQDRVFRNDPELRYENKIHEALRLSGSQNYGFLDASDELVILHTGYTSEAYERTGKRERNIQMLKKELKDNPEDVQILSYLGDVYLTERRFDQAKEYYRKAMTYGLEKGEEKNQVHTIRSIALLLMLYARESDPEQEDEVKELYRKSTDLYSAYPDGTYYFGAWLYQNKRYEEAKKYLESALDKLKWYKGNIPLYMTADLKLAYAQLADTCRHLDENEEAVRYCVMALGVDRYYTEPLIMLLLLLKKEEREQQTAAGIWTILSHLYNLASLKDQMMILKGAKLALFPALEERVYNAMPEEQRRAVQEALAKKVKEKSADEKSSENTD